MIVLRRLSEGDDQQVISSLLSSVPFLTPLSFSNLTPLIFISIYHSNRYPFSRALIGSRNSRYPRLLVDFEVEVKITGSARAKNRKKKGLHCIVFFLKQRAFLSCYCGRQEEHAIIISTKKRQGT